jgi:hypothetical protein
MPCEMWPKGSNAIAVTETTSTRRRVSDLAEFVYKRANFAVMGPGLRCTEIASSMSRRAYRPENTRTVSVGNNFSLNLRNRPGYSPASSFNRVGLNNYVEHLATLSFRQGSGVGWRFLHALM